LEPDLYRLVLDEQPSKYHSESSNLSAPSLFEQSWLDRVSDINNDAKHIRLTPQKSTMSLVVEKGTFRAQRLGILIEYLAPLVYAWSFAQHLPSYLESHERLRLSRALVRSLRAARHINNQDANPQQPHMQAYVAAVKSSASPEQIEKAAAAYRQCMEATCGADPDLSAADVAAVDWHRAAAYMLRRALKAARVRLAADKDEPLYPLLNRAIDKVSLLVREMQRATNANPTNADPTKCDVIVCVPAKPFPTLGSNFGDLEAALAASRPADAAAWSVQKWADVWPVLEGLQRWQQETHLLEAVARLHTDVAAELVGLWPWCSARILCAVEQMLLDSFDGAEQRVASLCSLAKCRRQQQLWSSATDAVSMALGLFKRLHGDGKVDPAPVAAARLALGELSSDVESERRAAMDGIDDDIVSQLEHASDVAFAIKHRCMDLALISNVADSTTLRRLELDCAAVVIKVRHVMEQSVRRAVQREIIVPETQAMYDRFSVFVHECADEPEWAALLATILADPTHPAFHATTNRTALHFVYIGSIGAGEWHFWGCRPKGYAPSSDAADVVSSSMAACKEKELRDVQDFLVREGLAAVKMPDMHGMLKALVFGALKYGECKEKDVASFPFTVNTELQLQGKLTDSNLSALVNAKDDPANPLHVRPPVLPRSLRSICLDAWLAASCRHCTMRSCDANRSLPLRNALPSPIGSRPQSGCVTKRSTLALVSSSISTWLAPACAAQPRSSASGSRGLDLTRRFSTTWTYRCA
jgi:hypothetical protein